MSIPNEPSDGHTHEELEEMQQSWYKEASEQTLETYPAFIQTLLGVKHCYSSITYACAAAAIGGVSVINKSPQGGITGFQAGCIGWEMVGHFLGVERGSPKRLIDYRKMLFPQYAYAFERTISAGTWEWLQEQAAKLLKVVVINEPSRDDHVLAHWRSILAGNVSFGYTVEY